MLSLLSISYILNTMTFLLFLSLFLGTVSHIYLYPCLLHLKRLLYLMDFKEMLDWEHFMPRVCQAIITGVELDEGDKLIIGYIAGLD